MAYKDKFAVLVAGGKGVRMGSGLPKQFLPLSGKPVLYHSISAFITAYPDIHIVLVLPSEQLDYEEIILTSFADPIDITIVAGGATRFHSVQNGLGAVTNNSIIFIHDGVRPVVSPELIWRCHDTALTMGSAIPVINVTDSVRMIENDHSRPVDRDHLRIIQTPQTFRSDVILPAFKQDYQASFTDEATVVEALGINVHLVEGERSNIKMTTPEDMIIARALLSARNESL